MDDDHLQSMVDLLQQLVRVPTRGGEDPLEPAVALLEGWLDDHDLKAERLYRDGSLVGLTACVAGAPGRPGLVLNAPLDTAPFGELTSWSGSPTSGDVRDGWLLGRGSADSKAGIAVFCHIAAWWDRGRAATSGDLTLLFDGDEHTGGFGGARAFFEDPERDRPIAGVMIGYPGNEKVVDGSRGFFRASLHVTGRGAHSGSSDPAVVNAVSKAATLVAMLDTAALPDATEAFGMAPNLTVTGMLGGEGFTVVPGSCQVQIDIRLVPGFEAAEAENLLRSVAGVNDAAWPRHPPTEVTVVGTWPPYRLKPTSAVAVALADAAEDVLGRHVPRAVSGPSNIGNFLASLGIEATAGFGVTYRGLHAADEATDVASLAVTYEVYRRAVLRQMTGAAVGCGDGGPSELEQH